MAISLAGTWYAALVDDSGSNTDGTIWTKAQIASFIAEINAAIGALTIVTPPQITANQNNYNPTGLSTCQLLRLSSDASRDITGIAALSVTRTMVLMNVGAQNIVLKNQSASSSAANQIACPGLADFTVNVGDAVTMLYDTTASLWRVVQG